MKSLLIKRKKKKKNHCALLQLSEEEIDVSHIRDLLHKLGNVLEEGRGIVVIEQVQVHTLFLHDAEGQAKLTPVSTCTHKVKPQVGSQDKTFICDTS